MSQVIARRWLCMHGVPHLVFHFAAHIELHCGRPHMALVPLELQAAVNIPRPQFLLVAHDPKALAVPNLRQCGGRNAGRVRGRGCGKGSVRAKIHRVFTGWHAWAYPAFFDCVGACSVCLPPCTQRSGLVRAPRCRHPPERGSVRCGCRAACVSLALWRQGWSKCHDWEVAAPSPVIMPSITVSINNPKKSS